VDGLIELSSPPMNVAVQEMIVQTAWNWHSIGDEIWPLPEGNECILAHYRSGPTITVNANFVRANRAHFDRWGRIPD
jgi:hypothetical protein